MAKYAINTKYFGKKHANIKYKDIPKSVCPLVASPGSALSGESLYAPLSEGGPP